MAIEKTSKFWEKNDTRQEAQKQKIWSVKCGPLLPVVPFLQFLLTNLAVVVQRLNDG